MCRLDCSERTMAVLRPTLSTTMEASAERADIAASANSNVDAAAAATRMFAAVVTPAEQEEAVNPSSRGRQQRVSKRRYEMVLGGLALLRIALELVPQAIRHAGM